MAAGLPALAIRRSPDRRPLPPEKSHAKLQLGSSASGTMRGADRVIGLPYAVASIAACRLRASRAEPARRLSVLDELQQQRLSRAIQAGLDQPAHQAADQLVLPSRALREEGAVVLRLLEMGVLLADVPHRHEAGVGDVRVLEQDRVSLW